MSMNQTLLERNFNKKTGLNFSKFYVTEFPKLVYHINGYTNNTKESEDLANDAFLKFLTKIDMWDASKGAALNTWLFTFAKYETIKEWKKKQKLPTVSMDKEVTGNSAKLSMFIANPVSMSNKEYLLNKAKANIIHDFIYSLPVKQEKYKKVLILREIDAMSYQEIADYLELNLSTVKSQIKKGREIIKDSPIVKTNLMKVVDIGIDDNEF